ncbi:S49 family peptidase [candidate division KSB1 bacterium]|nr:S49 family peptidase [candidate division KSB1 bacterium]
MKKNTLIAILLVPLSVGHAQNISNYYSKYDLLPAPPGTFQDGIIGFANPAALGLMGAPEARFYWTTDGPKTFSFDNWALLFGGRPFGFGMQQQNHLDKRVTDYALSFGAGSDAFAVGVGYEWPSGDAEFFNRQRLLKASAILRSSRLSLGLTGFWGLQNSGQEGVAELGLRPFGPTLTLFGDALFGSGVKFGEELWSAGAACRIVPGVTLVGRYFGTQAFTVGLVLDVGHASLTAQGHYDDSRNYSHNSYMLRSGGFKDNIFQRAAKNVAYVPFELKGRVDHQKYRLFDDKTHRLYDLLRDIRAAADDPRIAIIAINQTDMQIRPEHAWEVRQELKAAQTKGKRVLAYIESAGMTGYHLASVADHVVMEPQGTLILPGLVMGRTYLKGTLDKLGIGFDEWRFFTHKTAYETFSRENLSDADREQRDAYLDAWYRMLQEDISTSRHFSDHQFDAILNENVLFNGSTALEMGLVDKLDRWSNIEDIIKDMNHERGLLKMGRPLLWDNAMLAEGWGQKPQIALVYGLGECAMESGIRARYLEQLFTNLAKDRSIKAVVFRVDSPGGSGMASDLVAEALKKCAKKKPVIISQGQVAGSGGYWISMYGDKILAGPNTITGSIGVIGGWIWDEGLSAKLGMSADHVQRGEHADAMFGVTVPLLGLSIPGRNLTDDERGKIEKWIRGHYDDFISKVAQGRDMTKEEVDKIAQGRFYAGTDGQKKGLVDEIGGLMMAIDFAREDAGIAEDDEIELREYPRSLGLLPSPVPLQMAADKLAEDPVIRYLKMIAENPYEPLPMLAPGSYPTLER